MRKKLGALWIAASLLCSYGVPMHAETLQVNGKAIEYNLPSIALYVNGAKVETLAMNPVQIQGRVLVPTREVFEAMKASVHWNGTDKTVTVKYKTTTVILKVDQKQALVNGETKSMDVPAQIINGKVMIPVRFVSEALGMNVAWKGTEREIWITEPAVAPDNSQDNGSNTGQISGLSYTGPRDSHELKIAAQSYAQTKVQDVTIKEENGKAVCTIGCASSISDAEISIMTGKVVIDVKNSLSSLKSSITPAGNTYVKGIRTSQFSADTTRIVLDLQSGALVKTSLSADRRQLKVELSSSNLQGIEVLKASGEDVVRIQGIAVSQISVEAQGSEINWTIPNMKIASALNWQKIDGTVIGSMTVSQAAGGLSGSIQLKEQADYSMVSTGEGIEIRLKAKKTTVGENTEDNSSQQEEKPSGNTGSSSDNTAVQAALAYVAGQKPVINLSGLTGLKSNSITVTDNYRSKQLIFDLGKDYSAFLKDQTVQINDAYVKNIQVATHGTTKITVNTAQIYAYYFYNQENKVQIQLVRPSEKYNQIVVIDIGHGGADVGAVGNGLMEKDINYNQAMALYRLLEADSSIKVYLTRSTDLYLKLEERTTLANEIKADLFVSIHNNSASASVVGTETLYYPSTTDTRGKQVAQLIQNAIVKDCGMVNRGIKARSDLRVLNSTHMPAVLIETGFISNAEEAAKINSPAFIATWSKAVYAAIVQGFELM